MDADAIMAKQLRQMEKEKKEKEFKLKTQEKKVHVLASCHGQCATGQLPWSYHLLAYAVHDSTSRLAYINW